MSTLQEKQYLAKQQIMPPAKCCKQNHMDTRLFDLRKLSLQVEKSKVSSRRVGVKRFHFNISRVFTAGTCILFLAYSTPAFSFSLQLFLSLSSSYVCRHIQRTMHEFIAFFKIYVCFSKSQMAMQFLPKGHAIPAAWRRMAIVCRTYTYLLA